MIKVLFVCHGNICRSTMAQFVFQHMINEAGVSQFFHVDSRATSREEIGNPPHRGTLRKMKEEHIPVFDHYAAQLTMSDYNAFDFIIGMDAHNIRNLNRMTNHDPSGKIYKLLSFANIDGDIADPWYTGDFDATYRDVRIGCSALLQYLAERDPGLAKISKK